MEAVKKELMPNVILTCLKTDKFKTGCISISLLTQLTAETASKNAIIPRILRRGTTRHPDMESIAAQLNELYGARIEPVVRKKGELQIIGFFSDFADDAFVPAGEQVLERVAVLLGEMLLSPNTRGGLLLPHYVESEKEKLLEQIRGRVNEKRSYSVNRAFEFMCPGENYATDKLGTEEGAKQINYQKLTRHYKQVLSSSPIEIFYCGSADPRRVERALSEALLTLPRSEPDFEMGTDIRMNAVEDKPRYFTEEMDVSQGKLVVGYRLGDCMLEPDYAAIRVFNAVFGGSVTSKLFTNVREKLSLCYFASSMIDRHKGLMVVSSGIEFDKFDAALNEIFKQLEAVRTGDITDEELNAAIRSVSSELRASMDTPGALEDFYLAQNLEGLDYGPEELAALAETVTRDEIVEIANGVECDAVYFLKGPNKEDTDGKQEV